MARQAALGKPQGPVPLGYRNVQIGGMKAVELAESDTVRFVQEAFVLAAKGTPLRKVLAEMTARGLRSRHGKRLTSTSLHRILTNPFYLGALAYQGKIIPGRHEPIVTADIFEKVQDGLHDRRRG
jgi:site-specific DNA recombinase